MRSKLFKLLNLLVILALTASLAAGCKAGDDGKEDNQNVQNESDNESKEETARKDEETPPEESGSKSPEEDLVQEGWKKDTSPVTFDWYVNLGYFTQVWGKDTTSKYITNKTGVDINYIIPVSGSENEKMTIFIASGDMPDLITIYRADNNVKIMEEGGLLYPLNELADRYDPYFYEVAPESIRNWYTRSDGNIYSWPNFSTSLEEQGDNSLVEGNQVFLVRNDMYNAIGKPDMTTPEGFLQALQAAKEKFPEVDGKPLIPFGTMEFTDKGNWHLDGYLQDFLAIPFEKDGMVYDRRTDPEYILWLKTLRKANEMGLISMDIFIDNKLQIDEKVAQGRYFALLHQVLGSAHAKLVEKDYESRYTAIDAMFNSKGEQPVVAAEGAINGWLVNQITRDCKDPKRAISFFSYMISEEGQQDLILGEEGVTWEKQDGKDLIKKELWDFRVKDKKAFNEQYGAVGYFYNFHNPFLAKKWQWPRVDYVQQQYDWTKGKAKSQAAYMSLEPDADSDEGIKYVNIELKWAEVLPKLILSKTDEEFDKILDDFIKFREKNMFDKIVEIQTQKMKENKQRLGIN